MVSATTTPTTRCSGCGAKIPSTVSICPYCVTPLRTGAAAAREEKSPVLERLAQMKEKPEYQEGLAFTPLEGPSFQRAAARQRRGLALAAVGIFLLSSGLTAAGEGPPWLRLRVLSGLLLAAFGGFTAARALRTKRTILARPMLKRAARVADRRSETAIQGGRGDTIYFFDLELEDGTRAEFAYPGRGASDNPLTTGVTGIAYTRGAELVAFKRIRV